MLRTFSKRNTFMVELGSQQSHSLIVCLKIVACCNEKLCTTMIQLNCTLIIAENAYLILHLVPVKDIIHHQALILAAMTPCHILKGKELAFEVPVLIDPVSRHSKVGN